jgi:hypothetical protein
MDRVEGAQLLPERRVIGDVLAQGIQRCGAEVDKGHPIEQGTRQDTPASVRPLDGVEADHQERHQDKGEVVHPELRGGEPATHPFQDVRHEMEARRDDGRGADQLPERSLHVPPIPGPIWLRPTDRLISRKPHGESP